MITETNGFEFDKHILKVDKETLRKELKNKLFKRAIFKVFNKWEFEELVEYANIRIMNAYEETKQFFDNMNKQKYCDIRYIVDEDEEGILHKVKLSHVGTETFNLNGLTRFHTLKNSRVTTISVEKGEDTFDLILFNHPQVEIPTVGAINVDYDFKTEFSLGYTSYRKGKKTLTEISTTIPFNKKLLPKMSFPFPFEDWYYDYIRWYGKPGEVYYRCLDGFYQELRNSIFGLMITRVPSEHSIDESTLETMLYNDYAKRNRFQMHGTITFNRSNNFIYQGKLDSTGAFPFFLWKDDDDGRSRKRYIKAPVSGVYVEN